MLIYIGEQITFFLKTDKCESYVCWKCRVKAFSELKTGPRLSLWDFGGKDLPVLDVLGASRPCATTSAGWVSLKSL